MWAIKEKLQNISSVLISKLSGRYGETYLKKKNISPSKSYRTNTLGDA